MNAFTDHIRNARRLAVLTALFFAPGYCLPDDVLRDLVSQAGYDSSLDALRADLSFLDETGLVERNGNVPTLTERGVDVVCGRSTVDGVKRPLPSQIPAR